MGLLVEGLLDALVVVLTDALVKTRNYAPAGLIPLFPIFTLAARYIVANERSIEVLRTIIVFDTWSVILYFVYLVSLQCFTGIMYLPLVPAGAVGCWGLCA